MVRNLFQKWKTPQLQGHLVWIPMLPADDRAAALAQEALFQDERLAQYWDGERALGRLVSATLKLAIPVAWDVYLLYHPGAAWGDAGMPEPDFWMHQLDERLDLRLDPGRLAAEVQRTLASRLD